MFPTGKLASVKFAPNNRLISLWMVENKRLSQRIPGGTLNSLRCLMILLIGFFLLIAFHLAKANIFLYCRECKVGEILQENSAGRMPGREIKMSEIFVIDEDDPFVWIIE